MIVFNALQAGMNGGIGRYCQELSKELYCNSKEDIKIVIRVEELENFKFAKSEDLIVVEGINTSGDRNKYEQFKLPKLVYKKYPQAVLHYPDTMAPIFAKNDVVITIHDLAFKSMKNIFTWKSKIWKNTVTNLSVRKAKKIIAISNFTKEEIERAYGREISSKVEVVYNGFNDFSNDEISLNKVRKEVADLRASKYILTVSTISPRKNIDGLIKAYNELDCNNEYKLVIAGANGWLYEDVIKLVDDLKLNDKVIFTGKINDDELKFLYKNCELFAYVSFYEGFGLPPLEAMSYGKACVVSNKSSLPEVVGDAAIIVDPYNVNEIKDKINMALLDKDIKGTYEVRGIKNTARFSWKVCSDKTSNLYKEMR